MSFRKFSRPIATRLTGSPVRGVLALHEPQARSFGRDELRLLERMARELTEALIEQAPRAAGGAPELIPAHAG